MTSEGLFTLVTSSCFLDVDCSFFDVNVKILPDAQLVGIKKCSRPFFDVVKTVDAVTNVKTACVGSIECFCERRYKRGCAHAQKRGRLHAGARDPDYHVMVFRK